MSRLAAALLGGGIALLPLAAPGPGAAEPWRDPGGLFAIELPAGWSADDSGHLGPGLVARGPAAGGAAPVLHLTHEPAGVVTLDVRWQTILGQMRFDFERLRYLSVEDHEEAAPPYAQALYSYRRGEEEFVALSRLVRAGGRFYFMTAVTPEAVFADLHPVFLAAFDSFRPAAAQGD